MHKQAKRWAVAFCLLTLFASLVAAQGRSEIFNDHNVAAQEVLVKFRSPTLQNIGNALNAADADEIQALGGIPGLFRLHSRTRNAAALVRLLSMFADVEYAEPNYIVEASDLTPNDFANFNLWGMTRISAPAAWGGGWTNSADSVVAVVDTGIDYGHPDLSANVWSSPAAFSVLIGQTPITCPAGSHGFNAITNTCNPMDDNGHGSHVSGTIGAVGDNGMGVAGIGWTASIMGLKFLNANGSGTTANAINAIEFAIQAAANAGANVRVLSNSWGGGGYSQALLAEIDKANTSNMLFVAAAGNNGRNNDSKPSYPASYNAPNVVAVAATDSNDQLASWSNYGAASVHLGAPGVGIWSTIPNLAVSRSSQCVAGAGCYDIYSGTSMAAPHVSGAAALVLSQCALGTAADMKANLLSTVDQVASLVGKVSSGGRLNLNNAIQNCSGFNLSASPALVSVRGGQTATFAVSASSYGFAPTVNLSVSGSGYTNPVFSPTSITGSGLSVLTVTAGSTRGTYTMTITAKDASTQAVLDTATVQLKVK